MLTRPVTCQNVQPAGFVQCPRSASRLAGASVAIGSSMSGSSLDITLTEPVWSTNISSTFDSRIHAISASTLARVPVEQLAGRQHIC